MPMQKKFLYLLRSPKVYFPLIFLLIASAFSLLLVHARQGASHAAAQDSVTVETSKRQPPAETVPYRSPGAKHKLRVTDPLLARELAAEGAQLIADYGSFQLFSVDDSRSLQVRRETGAVWSDQENVILLNAGAIDTTKAELQQKRAKRLQSVRSGERTEAGLHLVQFAGPIKPEWYEELTATGVDIINYIPHNAYLVFGTAADLERVQTWAARSAYVQWDGAYESEFKLHPSVKAARLPKELRGKEEEKQSDLYAIQLVADSAMNQATLSLISQLKTEDVRSQFSVLKYVNLVVRLPLEGVEKQLAARPDVISVRRYSKPIKLDERQNVILTGNLTGSTPNASDYLTYLAGQGFTQSQFTASNFAINVSDSGIDNATTTPNHFALYTGGSTSAASRLSYIRLEGTANPNSTLQGCDGHGNLNAHIIAGFVPSAFNAFPHADASGFRYGLGVAPFVKVGASVIFDPNEFTFPNYADLEARAYQDNARISNNSWGEPNGATYTMEAQTYDILVRDAQLPTSVIPTVGNQEMVIIFAAGNQGPISSSITTPGTAKNIITVGAAENVRAFGGNDACGIGDASADSANDMADFSSRGPTADGRKKPDLVAPGSHITGGAPQIAAPPQFGQASACFTGGGICGAFGSNFFPTGQQFYVASSGTSHSAPAVAGAAALLRQRFINANQAPPSPALTKAVLMNTARYLNGAGAADSLWSNAQGMGEVNLTTALDIFTTPTVLRDQVGADILTATGQTRIVTGTVANSGKPFRVTLAWTDAPGSTTGNAYVNDLNLEVTVGGQTYRGNVFDGAVSATGGEFDSRNNVESVFIPAGVSGPFVVKITGANIAGDGVMNVGSALDQDFALVVSNATESAQPALTSIGSLLTGESCSPANNVIDPGETVTVSLGLQNLGTANTANLVATLQASGGVGNPGAAQNYGVVQAGGPSVFRSFTFVAGGTCGGTLTATLALQDGATNLGTVSFNFTLGTSTASTVTVTNNAAITIPAGPVGTTSGQASPYPSNLAVSGLTGAISKVTVTLLNASHTEPNDLDLLLVGPDGKKVLLMSDAGGTATMSNATLTFDDSALAVSETGPLTTGTYAPANYGGVADSFPSPAPAGPYDDPPRLSAFNGMSPNGTWALYVVDDSDDDTGSIQGGWSLTITTAVPMCCSSAGCQPITVNPSTAPNGAVGVSYNQVFSQTGGTNPVVFVPSGTLPPGLSFSGATLSGTPTQIGTYNLTVTAVDANSCIGSRNYTIAVTCPTINLSPSTLSAGVINQPYSQSLTPSGGVGPFIFSVTGTLPNGLSLSTSTGLLSGTPSLSGTFNFSVRATDVNGCFGEQNYQLVINGLQFYPLPKPVRLLDTRPGQGNCDNVATPIAAGTSITTLAQTTCEGIPIPAAAQAVVGNVTVINQSSQAGFLTVYPTGVSLPLAANMIYQPGQVLSNNFTVGLSADGKFNIYGERTLDVIVDISGYYAPPGTGGLYYHALAKPIRLLDTRANQGACDNVSAPIAAGTSLTTLARTTCENLTIPAAAKAIVGNATVINGSGQTGYLTIYPDGIAPPLAANMIYAPGQILSNTFTVGLSNDGKFNIFGERTIDMVVDVAGYFSTEATDANGPGLYFNPLLRPLRILDTRAAQGNCDSVAAPITGGTSLAAPAHLTCETITIPSTAQSVLGNVTVINLTAQAGYLTMYPNGVAQPLTANMVYFANQVLSNSFVVGLNTGTGQYRLFAERTLEAIVDVSGYFAP